MKRFTQKLSAVLALVLLMEEVFFCLPVSANEIPAGADFLPAQVISEEMISGEVISEENGEVSESAEEFSEEINAEDVIEVTNPEDQEDSESEAPGTGEADVTETVEIIEDTEDTGDAKDTGNAGDETDKEVKESCTPSDAGNSDTDASSDADRPSDIATPSDAEVPSEAAPPSNAATPSNALAAASMATPSLAASGEVQTIYWAINGTELTVSSFPQEGETTGEFPADSRFENFEYSSADEEFKNAIWGKEKIESIVVGDEETGDIVKPVGHFNWFAYLEDVTMIDFRGIDTSEVTNMSYLFYHCSDITKLDIGNWNTSSVTDMSYMFSDCENLAETGDIADWDVASVRLMNSMFEYCSSISAIDIGNWDTSSLMDMQFMFYGCRNLPVIDIGNWNLSLVQNMDDSEEEMFFLMAESPSETPEILTGNRTSVSETLPEDIPEIGFIEQETEGISLANFSKDIYETSARVEREELSEASEHVQTVYWALTGKVLTLSSYPQEGKETGSFLADSNLNSSNRNDLWYGKSIETVVFGDKDNGDIVRPVGHFNWLAYLSGIKNIDFRGIDISGVTDMSGAFYDCRGLTALDIGNWNTSAVTEMSKMFYGCTGLKALAIGQWNTSNVKNMSEMFYNCSGLSALILGNWNTIHVKDMNSMFYGCTGIRTLIAENWNTAAVTDMGGMFTRCTNLTALNIGNWNVSSVTNMNSMFYACGVNSLVLDKWNTSSVNNMGSMFRGCPVSELSIGNWNTASVTDMSHMFDGCGQLENLNIGNWNTISVTSMAAMFASCMKLIELDIGNWNTASLKHMNDGASKRDSGIFGRCTSLVTLNIGKWNTASVTNMNYVFSGCWSLQELDLNGWDTSSVTATVAMFADCSGLKELNISNWDTSSLRSTGAFFYSPTAYDLCGMFRNCSSLKTLDIENWNTSSLRETEYMFSGCTGIEELDLSNWNTQSLLCTSGMFSGCSGLISLDISSWDTSSLLYMGTYMNIPGLDKEQGMFYGCTSLVNLDAGNWNTSRVIAMDGIFSDCKGLKALNISGWSFPSIKKIFTFDNCISLDTVRFPRNITYQIDLPENGTWYYNDSTVTELPMNTEEPGIVSHTNAEYVTFKYLNQKGNWTETISVVNSGGGATAPDVPEQVGSNVFAGWQNNLYKTTKDSMEVKALYVTCDDPASVTWHKLRFYDGSSLFAEQIVRHGTAGQDPGVPVSDQPFYGWSGSYSCIMKDTDLYAQRQQKFNVIFTDYDGTADKYTVSGTGSVTAPAGGKREGYRFVHWKEAGGSTVQAGGKVTGVTKDLSYTAVYEKIYTATFKYRNALGILVSEKKEVDANGTVTAPQVPSSYTVSGGAVLYVFNGWSRALAGITADTVINALYTEKYRASFAVGDEVIEKYFASGESIVYPTEEELEAIGYGTEASIRAYVNGGTGSLSMAAPAGNETEGELPGSQTLCGASMADVMNRFKGIFFRWNSTTAVMPAQAVTIKAEVKTGNGFTDQLKKWFGITVTVTVKYYGTKSGTETYAAEIWKGEQVDFEAPEYKNLYPVKKGYKLKTANPYIDQPFRKDETITLEYYEEYQVYFLGYDNIGVGIPTLWGDVITVPSGQVWKGHKFEQWRDADGGTVNAGDRITVRSELVYYPVYSVVDTVIFRHYDGSEEFCTTESGGYIMVPAGKVRVGYKFVGWLEKDGTLLEAGIKAYGLTDGDIYTAKYEQIITVTFLYRSKETGKYLQRLKYCVKGENITAPQVPLLFTIKEGEDQTTYEFIGWDKSLENIAGPMTVTAQYKETKKTQETMPECDGTVLSAVEILGNWYLEHVSSYLQKIEKDDSGKYKATEEAIQYKENKLKTVETSEDDDNGYKIEKISGSNNYVTLSSTGRGMYVCELLDGLEHTKVGDDCSGFAMACIYLATEGGFDSNLDDCDSGTFAGSSRFEKCGFVRYNATSMKISDLQPGDILVDRHEKQVFNSDGTPKLDENGEEVRVEVGHVEFVYSEPVQKGQGWVVEQTFGWGQVQNMCPKNNEVIKKEATGCFADGSHENYKWVLRKVR